MTHTTQERDALNGLLDLIEGSVRTAIELGAGPQIRARLSRLIGDRTDERLEMSAVLTQLRAFEKQRRHTRADLDAIDNAKEIIKRRMQA